MSLSILDIAPVLAGDPDQQITWFQQRGLIARNKTCPSCSSVMHMQCRNDIQDKRRYSHVPKSIKHSIFCGWIAFQFDNRWRCVDDGCKKSCSIRAGTFFDKSKLSLQQWLVIIFWWVRQYPVTKAAEEAKVSEPTGIQTYQYLRDICSWRLMTVDSPLLLGGQGVVVQIDESLFRHKPKVT